MATVLPLEVVIEASSRLPNPMIEIVSPGSGSLSFESTSNSFVLVPVVMLKLSAIATGGFRSGIGIINYIVCDIGLVCTWGRKINVCRCLTCRPTIENILDSIHVNQQRRCRLMLEIHSRIDYDGSVSALVCENPSRSKLKSPGRLSSKVRSTFSGKMEKESVAVKPSSSVTVRTNSNPVRMSEEIRARSW